jgi:hypothetical protein
MTVIAAPGHLATHRLGTIPADQPCTPKRGW